MFSKTTLYNVALLCAVAGVALLVLLGTVRLRGADIDLAVRTSVVHLRLAHEEVRLPPFNTSRLQLLGDSTVEDLPGFAAFNGSAELVASSGSALSLARLIVPANGGLSLRRIESSARGYELAVERGSQDDVLAIEVVATKDFSVSTGGRSTLVAAASPVAFRVSFKDRNATLRLVLDEASWSLSQPIPVTGLGLIDVLPTGRPAEFSGVLDGSVHFPSSRTLAGEPSILPLRRGELLTVGKLESASLAHLSLDGSAIDLGVLGVTHALDTRWRNGSRDHMPSYLGWLSSFDWIRAAAALSMALIGGGVLANPMAGGKAAGEGAQVNPSRRERRAAGALREAASGIDEPPTQSRVPYQHPHDPYPAPPAVPMPRRRT